MGQLPLEASEDEVRRARELAEQLLSFSSHDMAIAFLHRHQSRLNRALIELLKEKVAVVVRVDLDRALVLADLTTEAARLLGDPVGQALGYHARAMVLYGLGQYASALDLYSSAQDIYQSLGQEVEAARVARAKLPALMCLGRYQEALQVADEARRVLQQHGQLALAAQVDANLGILYERLDQYQTALTYYQRAADTFEQLGDRSSLAVAQTNLALIYSYLNQYERSLALYGQARRTFQELGLPLLALQVDHNVAWLYFLRGRFDHALRQFYQVNAKARQHGDVTQAAICQLDLAELYLQLNAFEDALEASQSAAEQFARLQMTYELAKAKMYRGVTHLHLNALNKALTLLQDARRLFAREGNQIYQALSDLYLSEVAIRQGQWDQAINLCQTAAEVFEANHVDNKAAYAQLQLARIRFHAGDWPAAQSACELSLQRIASLEAPWLKYQCFHLKGNLAERAGDQLQAYQCYRQAINHVEEMRGTIRVDEFKATFVKDKVRVYEDLVRLCLNTESWQKKQEAFSLAEAAKSRALVDLLSSILQLKSRDNGQADQDLITRWSRLREELDWHYNKLNEYESKPPPRPTDLGQQLRQQIRQREAELARLLRELQLKDPERLSLHSVPHVTSADIAESLAEDEVLIDYYISGHQINVFVLDRTGLRLVQPLGSTLPLLDRLRKLRFQLNKYLLNADYLQRHEPVLRLFTNDHLQGLYHQLIEPLVEVLIGKRLIIAPHSFLHYVPFHALFDGRTYLIDHHEISYCPSAHVFYLCRQRGSWKPNGLLPALIVGVPDAGLPHIVEEVERVGSLIPGAETLAGDAATADELKRRVGHCRLLHLASHAVFRQDNPLFSSLKLANSWLNFYDLFHLELQAELVTLSACQTGVSKIFAGDELVGLMRGFLYAGAPSLILSLWAVNDRSTTEFMGTLYTHLSQGRSPRSALREAQLTVREIYPHPYHWAPFVLMGRP